MEQPLPTQGFYCFDRVPALVAAKPELKDDEPFKTVLSGDRAAIAKLPMPELEKLLMATLTGMTTDQFQVDVKAWLGSARDSSGNAPTPNSPTNRCRKLCGICATTASRRISLRAEAGLRPCLRGADLRHSA